MSAPPPRHDYLGEPQRPKAPPKASEYYRGERRPAQLGAGGRQPAPFADHRGLSLVAALTLAGVLTGLGAVADAELAAPSDATLRTLFTACFAVGVLLAAFFVRRERAGSVVVAAPIYYALAALVGGAIYAHRNAQSVLKEGALDAVTSMVTHAPTLLVVTALAALLAWLRRRAGQPARRPVPPRY